MKEWSRMGLKKDILKTTARGALNESGMTQCESRTCVQNRTDIKRIFGCPCGVPGRDRCRRESGHISIMKLIRKTPAIFHRRSLKSSYDRMMIGPLSAKSSDRLFSRDPEPTI